MHAAGFLIDYEIVIQTHKLAIPFSNLVYYSQGTHRVSG